MSIPPIADMLPDPEQQEKLMQYLKGMSDLVGTKWSVLIVFHHESQKKVLFAADCQPEHWTFILANAIQNVAQTVWTRAQEMAKAMREGGKMLTPETDRRKMH